MTKLPATNKTKLDLQENLSLHSLPTQHMSHKASIVIMKVLPLYSDSPSLIATLVMKYSLITDLIMTIDFSSHATVELYYCLVVMV